MSSDPQPSSALKRASSLAGGLQGLMRSDSRRRPGLMNGHVRIVDAHHQGPAWEREADKLPTPHDRSGNASVGHAPGPEVEPIVAPRALRRPGMAFDPEEHTAIRANEIPRARARIP